MTAPWFHAPEYRVSPNITGDVDLYEIENLAADPDRTVERAMRRIASWDGKVVMDIGAGTGHYIDRLHEDAAHVIAVEPDPMLRMCLMQRLADRALIRTSVIGASAASIPLCDGSVDIAHARFAYFFGPGCEAGVAELERILTPGGTAFIIDNDLRTGTFAAWVKAAYGDRQDPDKIESFWQDQGFTIERVSSRWRFARRDDFERVVRLEFPTECAERVITTHSGLEVDCSLLLIHKTFGEMRSGRS